MHSSRMRTGRSLTVCCSLLPGGGVSLPGGGLVPGVAAWSWGSPCWGFSRGALPAGGLPGPGGVCLPGPEGVSLLGGGSPCRGGLPGLGGCVCLVPGGLPAGGSVEPPPVNRITDTCKNITLATTSLRPVNILMSHHEQGYSSNRCSLF